MSQTPKRRRPPRQPAVPSSTAVAAAESAAQPTPEGPPPLRLTLAAAIAGVEGLAVAAWGAATTTTGGGNAILAGLLVLIFAALPLAAAYGLRRARRWSRGPALIVQLLSLPVAWTMLHSDGLVIAAGAALGVLALSAMALLVHPATTDALGISRTAAS